MVLGGGSVNSVNYKISADTSGLRSGIKEAKTEVQNLKTTTENASSSTVRSLTEIIPPAELVGNAFGALNIDAGELAKNIAEVAVAVKSIQLVKGVLTDVIDTYNDYNDAMFSVKATAAATGQSIVDSIEAVREVASRGLLSQEESAIAIRNLLSYGYTVQQAIEMTNAMSNSASVLRRENYSLAEAVVTTTEGIRQNSSMKSKAAGNTQTLSQMEESYAISLGKTASELTNAERRQAYYNATIALGNQYAGYGEAYANTLATSQNRLSIAVDEVKHSLGSVLSIFAPMISGIASWISENKELIAVVTSFVVTLIGGVGLVIAIGKAVQAIRLLVTTLVTMSSISHAAVGGVVAVAVAVAALTAAMLASNKFNEQLDATTVDLTNDTNDLGDAFKTTGGAIRDNSKQLERLHRQYLTDLKTIENRHLETINKLTEQIKEANVDYKRAIEERNAEFAISQAKEERTHQEKVTELMNQIAFLQRYNNQYNREKLAQLEFALAKENSLYRKQTEAEKAELELQNANDLESFEKKRKALQDELDDELAFMARHREDLQVVRDFILEDEIDSLKRRYEEQQASYAEQASAASTAGLTAGTNWAEAYANSIQDQMANLKSAGDSAGTAFGDSFFSKATSFLSKTLQKFDSALNNLIFGDPAGMSAEDERQHIIDYFKQTYGANWEAEMKRQGYASGGFTGRGASDEIAGFVHKGEYVLPAEMVDQSTGTPRLGTTINNFISVSGTFATSQHERRKVAEQIAVALGQINKSRLGNDTAYNYGY